MKALVYEGGGSLGALAVRTVDRPAPGDRQVLVRIAAASVNAADYRSIRMRILPKGRIPGADIAGRVEAVGRNAGKFGPGDEVLGDLSPFGFGGFAEYAAVPESALTKKPAGVSFEDAAALPMASVTALQALRAGGDLRPGQRVLICGAGGGVGTFAVQLAKHLGAEVTAVCSGRGAAAARSLGADHVIDYEKTDFTRSGERYDLILAVNGNHPLTVYRRLLAPKGACVLVGGALSQVVKGLLFGALLSVGGRKMRLLAAKASANDLAYIAGLVERGAIRPAIDRRYPLDGAADAVRYAGEGHARGKVVIIVDDPADGTGAM